MTPLDRHQRRLRKRALLANHRSAYVAGIRNGILIGMAAATAGWWVMAVVLGGAS